MRPTYSGRTMYAWKFSGLGGFSGQGGFKPNNYSYWSLVETRNIQNQREIDIWRAKLKSRQLKQLLDRLQGPRRKSSSRQRHGRSGRWGSEVLSHGVPYRLSEFVISRRKMTFLSPIFQTVKKFWEIFVDFRETIEFITNEKM